MASPMDTVYSKELDAFLGSRNIPVMVHRYFPSYKEQLEAAFKPESNMFRFFAVGTNLEWITGLLEAGIRHFCVDMAHGDCKACVDTIKHIKRVTPESVIIAGNVATKSGFRRLEEAGAWAIRVGIGSGSICSTRLNTGFGVPLLTSVEDCASVKDTALVIADGGMKYPGDLAKAIAFGADLCMMGRMFAGTDLAPGDCYDVNKKRLCAYDEMFNLECYPSYKKYRGMACYSSDTEIFTNNGWKFFDELDKNDEVATLNREKNIVEYNVPNMIFEYDYEGSMHRIKNRRMDLLVTPNHKLYIGKRPYKDGDEEYHLVKSEDAYQNLNGNIFSSMNNDYIYKLGFPHQEGKDVDEFVLPNSDLVFNMDDWLYFYGFWLAEGSTYTHKQKVKYDCFCTCYSNNNLEIMERCNSIFDGIGVSYSMRNRDGNYETKLHNRDLFNYLSQFGKANEKFIDRRFMNLSSRQLKILLQGIFDGDGCESRGSIYSVSKKLINDIFEICIKIGNVPSVNLRRDAGVNYGSFIRNHDLYEINIGVKLKNQRTFAKNHNFSIESYKGTVHCVDVKNHVVFVKRNGRALWCGNSAEARQGVLKKASVEGVSGLIKYTGTTEEFVEGLHKNLQAAQSYSGSTNWRDFRRNTKKMRISSASWMESQTHVEEE
jgi:IMP dehydrogenase/GMP reductase